MADIAEFIRLCREGRYADCSAWIAAGKPFQPVIPEKRGGRVLTPLRVAIETGQHSLVVLLLTSGYRHDLEPKSPFTLVLEHKQYHLLDPLFEHGVDPRRVDTYDLLESYDAALIERFWRAGFDFTADGELAAVLGQSGSNKPLYGLLRRLRTEDRRFQKALDYGLCYAVEHDDERAAALCLWAGADARRKTLDLAHYGEEEPKDEEDHFTPSAVERAVFGDHRRMFEVLKVDPKRDDFTRLYELCFSRWSFDALIAIAPPPDWKPVVGHFLGLITWDHRWEDAVYCLDKAIAAGVVLDDVGKDRVRSLQKAISKGPVDQARHVLRILKRLVVPAALTPVLASPSVVTRLSEIGGTTLLRQVAKNPSAAGALRRVARDQAAQHPVQARSWTPHDPSRYVRLTRSALYEQVWSKPMTVLGAEYGLSDNGLRKICAKMDVPWPPRGYWRRRECGHTDRRPPLPKPLPGSRDEVWLERRAARAPATRDASLDAYIDPPPSPPAS